MDNRLVVILAGAVVAWNAAPTERLPMAAQLAGAFGALVIAIALCVHAIRLWRSRHAG